MANGRGQAVLDHLPTDRPVMGVEVGVCEGYLSAFLLEKRLDMTLFMVDPWGRRRFLIYMGEAIERTDFAAKRRMIMQMASLDAAKLFPDSRFDFVFVDGDHSYGGVCQDIDLWMPKIVLGGWLCGDDLNLGDVRRAVETKLTGWEEGAGPTWFYQIPKGEGDGVAC